MDLDNYDQEAQATDQELYLENENNCCLCGSELHFEHTTDLATATIKEQAQCPTCGVQLKEKKHIIH